MMPKCSCAQPLAIRNPVMTSSKHSSAPLSVHSCLRPCAVQRGNLKSHHMHQCARRTCRLSEPSWDEEHERLTHRKSRGASSA